MTEDGRLFLNFLEGNFMAASLEDKILQAVGEPGYRPVKPKALARRLNVRSAEYPAFREKIKELIRKGKLELGKARTVGPATKWSQVVGVFRSMRGGKGLVRPRPGQGKQTGDILIKARNTADAATGDVVLVHILKSSPKPNVPAIGQVVEVIERASHHFVGTYYTEEGEGFVRVDGGVFHEDIYVGDAGAKNARDNDKVVFEMLRFPSPEMMGEGVITEVLGPQGEPTVDLLSVIREFQLPDEFPEEVQEEARQMALAFADQPVTPGRVDLTAHTVVTIDPKDARDFDDAITVIQDENGHWQLWVHIADVATFVPQGSAMDREARKRGTSVYLPGKVLPMLPELISNGLASLQHDRLRYTKTVHMHFDPEGRPTGVDFLNGVIKVTQRLTYERVMQFFETGSDDELAQPVRDMLLKMRELARILRERRRARGFLEMFIPEPELDYDDEGRVCGAHYVPQDESHQVIEEFMLTANEAVAQKLTDEKIVFLRRIHEIPDPLKLKSLADFLRSMGINITDYRSRFELQRILREVADKPERMAVNYAMLRSMKIAVYSPEEEGHFAIASDCYCHFTSPIRRYPDLVVHRLLDQWIQRGKAGSDYSELIALGEHCSFTERRAEKAERELIKIKLLNYLSDRVGEEMEMIITGVEEYGFFAMGKQLPAEGLVHIRTLTDDYYHHDPVTHTLTGQSTGKQFRLGDDVRCVIAKVDRLQRQLDLKLAEGFQPPHKKKSRRK